MGHTVVHSMYLFTWKQPTPPQLLWPSTHQCINCGWPFWDEAKSLNLNQTKPWSGVFFFFCPLAHLSFRFQENSPFFSPLFCFFFILLFHHLLFFHYCCSFSFIIFFLFCIIIILFFFFFFTVAIYLSSYHFVFHHFFSFSIVATTSSSSFCFFYVFFSLFQTFSFFFITSLSFLFCFVLVCETRA